MSFESQTPSSSSATAPSDDLNALQKKTLNGFLDGSISPLTLLRKPHLGKPVIALFERSIGGNTVAEAKKQSILAVNKYLKSLNKEGRKKSSAESLDIVAQYFIEQSIPDSTINALKANFNKLVAKGEEDCSLVVKYLVDGKMTSAAAYFPWAFLSHADLNKYEKHMLPPQATHAGKNLGAGIVRAHLSAVRRVIALCAETGCVPEQSNVVIQNKRTPIQATAPTPPEEDKKLSAEAIDEMILVAGKRRNGTIPKRDKAMLLVMLNVGIDHQQIIKLKSEDYDTRRCRFTVTGSRNTPHFVKVTDRKTKSAMTDWLKLRSKQLVDIQQSTPLFNDNSQKTDASIKKSGLSSKRVGAIFAGLDEYLVLNERERDDLLEAFEEFVRESHTKATPSEPEGAIDATVSHEQEIEDSPNPDSPASNDAHLEITTDNKKAKSRKGLIYFITFVFLFGTMTISSSIMTAFDSVTGSNSSLAGLFMALTLIVSVSTFGLLWVYAACKYILKDDITPDQ